MEIKERIIDFRQYFIYLWENAVIIVLITLIFMCGMAGLSYYKQNKILASSTMQDVGVIEDIIEQNHDAYYHLNNVTAFTDAEQPAGTYNSSVRLFVDFDFSVIEGNANLDFSQMSNKVQQDTMILLTSDEALRNVIEKLNLNSYDDMKSITVDDLKWMINRNYLGANVLQIVVTDVDPDRAYKIAEAVVDEFLARSDDFETIDSARVMDPVTQARAGRSGNLPTRISRKIILKYAIVGCAGGFALMAVIYLLIFIFKDAVRTSLDVEFTNMKVFGYISKKKGKKVEDIKRVAYNISLLKTVKKIALIPTDKKSQNEDLIDQIKDELSKVNKDIKIETAKNIRDFADATMLSMSNDAIIVLATYGKTSMKDLLFAKNELDKTGKEILGTIIGESR